MNKTPLAVFIVATLLYSIVLNGLFLGIYLTYIPIIILSFLIALGMYWKTHNNFYSVPITYMLLFTILSLQVGLMH